MKIMKNGLNLCAFIMTLLGVCGCTFFTPSGRPASLYSIFLPGESLKSNVLYSYTEQPISEHIYHIDKQPHLRFWVTLDMESDTLSNSLSGSASSPYHEIKPTDAAFNVFNNNSKQVKKEYNNCFSEILSLVGEGFDYTSIYYDDDVKLLSDISFNGIPAGENLWPVTKIHPSQPVPVISQPKTSLLNFENSLPRCLVVVIPISENDLSNNDNINIHLEIPVKVGLFLNYLNDRITNPNAEMKYRNEVLSGDFTFHH